MIVPDINLLLYATVSGFPQHEPAKTWLEDVLNGTTPLGLTPPAIFGFIRIGTNGRILASPMSVAAATGRIRDWLELPHVRVVPPGPRHLEIAFGLLEAAGTGADLTTDVQLAAAAIELDAELHSNDTDFGRFEGLRWVDPLRGGRAGPPRPRRKG